jgi:Circadian oscillating protein COP23
MQSDPVNFCKTLTLLSLSICSVFAAILPAAVDAKSADFFTCEQDRKEVFVTIVKNRNSGNIKELIRWESKSIANPRSKCWEVSARFQDFWSKGNLNYLKISTDKNQKTIVCGLPTKTSTCNDRNKIFELSATNPGKVYKELMKKLRAERNDGGIYQSANDDDEIIIDFRSSIEQR